MALELNISKLYCNNKQQLQSYTDRLEELMSCIQKWFVFILKHIILFVTPSHFIQSPIIVAEREGLDYCCIWSWNGDHFLSLKVPLWAKIQTNWGGDKQKDIFNRQSRKIDYGRTATIKIFSDRDGCERRTSNWKETWITIKMIVRIIPPCAVLEMAASLK